MARKSVGDYRRCGGGGGDGGRRIGCGGSSHHRRRASATAAAIAAEARTAAITALAFALLATATAGPGLCTTAPDCAQIAHAQGPNLDMELDVSDGDKAIILGGFAAAVVGIFLFLARDIILRKKTEYDAAEYESKKEKTYEKYHSDWTDDYEEIGTRKGAGAGKSTGQGRLWDESADGRGLPDYYGILGVGHDATGSEIKEAFRRLAKEQHPDRARQQQQQQQQPPPQGMEPAPDAGGSGSGSNGAGDGAGQKNEDASNRTMAEINEAYEVLSDPDLREEYDLRLGM